MIREKQEVFKAFNEKAVRGYVRKIFEKNFTVTWITESDEKDEETFNLEEIDKNVFTSEIELIRAKGSEIKELAKPLEIEVDWALDFYDLPLKSGAFVIAMSSEPLYLKIEGYIKRLYKVSTLGSEDVVFLDLVDKENNPIYTKTLARFFSLPERFRNEEDDFFH